MFSEPMLIPTDHLFPIVHEPYFNNNDPFFGINFKLFSIESFDFYMKRNYNFFLLFSILVYLSDYSQCFKK